MINEGTHDYGRDPFSLPGDMDPRAAHVLDHICVEDHAGCYMHAPKPDTEERRARPRQATVPTLGELIASSDMVTGPNGELVPASVAARGGRGWDADQDRDSTQAAKLAGLVKDMDESVSAWLADSSATVEEAERIMGLWQAIRKITQGNQP